MLVARSNRREFIAALGSAAAWPLVELAQQQQPGVMKRVGILMPYAGDREFRERVRLFQQQLAKLGWTDDENIQFDEHWTIDDMELVRSNAASLMASGPDALSWQLADA